MTTHSSSTGDTYPLVVNAGRTSSVAVASLVGLALLGGTAGAYWTTAGSGSGSASTDTLGAPANVTVSAVTGSSDALRVEWDAPAAEAGRPPSSYTVVSSADEIVCTVPAGTFSCDDDQLSPETTLSYTVSSILGSWTASAPLESGTTNQAQAVLNITDPGPAPNNEDISVTPVIKGTTDKTGDVTVNVYAGTEATGTAVYSEVIPLAAGVTTWQTSAIAPALQNSATYTARASQTTTGGESHTDRTFTTVSAAPTDDAAPTQQITVPAQDGYVAAGSTVLVTGTASDPSGVSSLKLQMSVNGGTYAEVGTTGTAAPNATASATYSWTVPSSGTIEFRTTATDGATPANTGNSTERTMTVGTPSLLLDAPASWTAGTAQNVTLTAKRADGTTDTDFAGSKAVTFSGPGTSPSGSAPTYPAAVTFTAGQGTASVLLFKAETTTLTATVAGMTADDAVTVIPATALRLTWTSQSSSGAAVTCADNGTVAVGNNQSWTAKVSRVDTYGNAAAVAVATDVAISWSTEGGGTVTTNPAANPLKVTLSQNAAESTGSVTAKQPNGGQPKTISVTATLGSLTVSCAVDR